MDAMEAWKQDYVVTQIVEVRGMYDYLYDLHLPTNDVLDCKQNFQIKVS